MVRWGFSLQWAAESLRDDKPLVLRAVSGMFLALESASKRLRSDREVVLTGLRQGCMPFMFSPRMMEVVGVELRDDLAVVLLMLQKRSRCPFREFLGLTHACSWSWVALRRVYWTVSSDQ